MKRSSNGGNLKDASLKNLDAFPRKMRLHTVYRWKKLIRNKTLASRLFVLFHSTWGSSLVTSINCMTRRQTTYDLALQILWQWPPLVIITLAKTLAPRQWLIRLTASNKNFFQFFSRPFLCSTVNMSTPFWRGKAWMVTMTMKTGNSVDAKG